jgi:hypothetical protein
MNEKGPEFIDVIKSSPLETGIELEKGSGLITSYKDKASNLSYYEKDLDSQAGRQNISVERFVSMVSKGILRTSDIIEKDGKYYSRLNYRYQENSEPAREGELEAEMFLLLYLFGDWDKSATDTSVQDNIYTQGDAFAHFDYGEAFRNYPRMDAFLFSKDEDASNFKEKIKILLDDPVTIDAKGDYYKRLFEDGNRQNLLDFYRKIAPGEAIERELFEKTLSFEEALHSEPIEGAKKDFFTAVIERAQLDLFGPRFSFLTGESQEERIDDLRHILLGRLKVLEEVLLERKSS